MLTKIKKQIQEILSAQAKAAHKIGLTPNSISIFGFVLALAASVCYAVTSVQLTWMLLAAVFFLLASGFCDTLDGIVARTFQQTTVFGGFFDSLLDRYADAAVYIAIIIAGLCDQIWGLIALAGSILVSYSRARAEAAGIKMESVGVAERAERILILATVSIISIWWLPALNYGVIVLAVLSNFTVLQRAMYTYYKLKKKEAV